MKELKAEWRKQIKELDRDNPDLGNKIIRYAPQKAQDKIDAQLCVDHAVKHSFERVSVMADRRVLEAAYKQAIGRTSVSLGAITKQFDQDSRILHVPQGSRKFCTVAEVLKEEQRMVQLARMGQGQLTPLYVTPLTFDKLKGEQIDAATHVLTTRHRVTILRGAAGTGKTTLMKETVARMEAVGKRVFVVAPTAEASRGVLRSEGFKEADTVAKFLGDKEAHKKLTKQIIWCDEAGLLGTKDMTALLELATKHNARLILGGDTRQHSAVVRGDALRILNTVGGIKAAEVTKIYRQKDASYRGAVEALSKGNIKDAFDKLDGMGAIKAVNADNPNDALVNDYIAAIKKKKSALIVSPTHKQGDAVTDAVRQKLRQARMIGKKEIKATRYSNVNMTAAEKADLHSYQEGQSIQFNQNLRGIKRGSLWTVKAVIGNDVQISNGKGKTISLPRSKAENFDVFRKSEIDLSKGDKIRITRNGFDEKEKRLNNGTTLEVVKVSKKGKILLRHPESKTTYHIKNDFGHIAHAHCVTSHASQGKTVDEVFISQPASTFSATDLKQMYVSVSRGRDAVHLYTDDKAALLDHASELGDRQSALEMLQHSRLVDQMQRKEYSSPAKLPQKEKDKTPLLNKKSKDIDYEPV